MFAPDVLDLAVAFLADLAGAGPVLEFAIGSGRVAIPLTERGFSLTGVELPQPIVVDQLRRKISDLPVVVGDMTEAECSANSHSSTWYGTASATYVPKPSRLLASATQQGTSHHYARHPDGTVTYGQSDFRYIWPAQCDLMARLAGMTLERRMADWNGTPFTGDSESHLSVWRKQACPAPKTAIRLRWGVP